MVIFNSYVSLPEGNTQLALLFQRDVERVQVCTTHTVTQTHTHKRTRTRIYIYNVLYIPYNI